MKTTTQKVADFHNLFEHPVGKLNELEPLSIRQLRIKLLFEELEELAQAGDVNGTFLDLCYTHIKNAEPDNGQAVLDGDNVNKVEELDAISDIQYVLDGKKVTSGLYEISDAAFDLVHENNMKKAHRDREHAKQTVMKTPGLFADCIERDGVFLLVRKDGKLIKPWDHKKVDLSILFNHEQPDSV